MNIRRGWIDTFHRKEAEIFGLTKEAYNNRVEEIANFMTDENKSKEAGVRSFWGNFVHYDKKLYKGLEFVVWVEQTGGIVIKTKEVF